MTLYRENLPQLGARKFITDGGLETVMVFQRQIVSGLTAGAVKG